MGISEKRLMLYFAILLIALPVVIWLVFTANKDSDAYAVETASASLAPATEQGMQSVPDGSLEELSGFVTNLPIVVMDVGGQTMHVHSVWDTEKGYFVGVDYDPNIEGSLSLIDAKDGGDNHLSDPPQLTTGMRIHIRGASSQTFPKKQYHITFLNPDGTTNEQDVLGMGLSGEWVLNISYIDKSLLRNYLAYTIAAQVMPHAPRARFCEVFFKEGSIYRYKGLYLLIQPINRGNSMIPLSKYDKNFTESSYILRRDRFSESGLILNTYGTKNKLTAEYLSVMYPPQDRITAKTTQYILDDINKFEEALFAEDRDEFLKYKDYIDIDSFADYFILNEFFGNYDSIEHSAYMYKEVNGKLTMGPVWDFDRAIGNDYPNILKIDTTAMHDGVWFRQLLRDGNFVKLIIDRYAELRKGALSDAYIDATIDAAIRHISPAQQRDWNRWDYNSVYDAQANGEAVGISLLPLTANNWDYDETVANLKLVLREHGAWMDKRLDSLYQFSNIEPAASGQDTGGLKALWSVLALLVVIGFFISVYLIQKE